MSNKNTGANGYTLIEVVITMFITATVFVGVYALFAKAMKYDAEGRHEIIASELVQEGIEMIKNKKEKNEMDWAVWKPSDSNNPDYSEVDNLTTFNDIDSLIDCNPMLSWDSGYSFSCNASNTTIRYNKTANRYETNCTGSDCVGPEYTRRCNTIMIDTDNNSDKDSLKVDCEVGWKSDVLNGGERNVKAGLVLTDWER